MTKARMQKLMMIIIVLAIIVIVAAVYLRPGVKLPKPIKIDTTDQPMLGSKTANAHIVAFEDLKCGNCMRFSTTIFPKIKKQFIDTGKANYTLINVAFIPGSMPAANAARCLYKQNKAFFFPFVKYVYNHQPSEETNWATIPKLLEFASHIKGVDTKALGQCIYKSPYTAFIKNNLKQGMKIMGGSVATPTVYVNGMIVKPLTMNRLRTLINAAQ